ncbi:MarR family winged helix-turn-helix transcriptional regulator [Rhodoferax sp.]|uniref:MarR family winged helix-turn-helix transcriptional regulator n=1 Tax=Rhodoferax sp. TaxID=50421 RepID=UPI002626F0CD|nr:MarR family winged helix-turn-helix transcriptional regulator [Rhodoferax sp.]MDD2926481.1 MarR family winged helix-turn-helix transcriptional regulator [Rhodoferax sp.]
MAEKIYLYHQLQLAAARLRSQADRLGAAAAGVSGAQAGVLLAVAAKPGASQRAVAQALGQSESGFTTMVSRLVAAELVLRTHDSVDPRAWALTLTPKGEDALVKVKEGLKELNRLIDRALSAQEKENLSKLLSRIVEAVNE